MYYAVWDGEDYLYTGYNLTDKIAVRNDLADLLDSQSEIEYKYISLEEMLAINGYFLDESDMPFPERALD